MIAQQSHIVKKWCLNENLNVCQLNAWITGAITPLGLKGSYVGGHWKKGPFLGEMGLLALS